jgi:hypothetical protein
MRFHWPPSENHTWRFETVNQTKNQTKIFFPLQKHNFILLGVRIQGTHQPATLTLPVAENKAFQISVEPDVWTMLPYPIECHAIETIWQVIEIDTHDFTMELAYYHWESRQFRMRALVDVEGTMILAYRINKKGQTVAYLPPKDHIMTLPEDAYIIPPTSLINEKSILLQSSQTTLPVKKVPEGRYFLV